MLKNDFSIMDADYRVVKTNEHFHCCRPGCKLLVDVPCRQGLVDATVPTPTHRFLLFATLREAHDLGDAKGA
jgi:hypothetical protein